MEVYSEVYAAEHDMRMIKAPKGKMFAIYGAQFVTFSGVANTLAVEGRDPEERVVSGMDETSALFVFACDEDGHMLSVILPKPIKRKRIVLMPRDGTDMQCYIIVYYELIDVSMADLIWEFVRRGKNP